MNRLTSTLRAAALLTAYLLAVAGGAALAWGTDPIIIGGVVALAGVVGAVLTSLGVKR